jgi:hypothetical protein
MVTQKKTVRPNVVNGINVDDLIGLIDANAETNWHVATTWQGHSLTSVRIEIDKGTEGFPA